MLPNAHAILFILAADTGVTKSDIEVWRNHIGSAQGRQKGRLVVLNKIDSMWDELKGEEAVEGEIRRQVETTAELLALDPAQIFPVSAQKGLLAKVNHDAELLLKSRLPDLEKALSDELIPSKQEIVRDNTEADLEDMIASTGGILRSRLAGVREQLSELKGLRGKNQDVIEHMMARVQADKQDFEKGLQRFQALRSVFSHHTNVLFSHLGMDSLKHEIKTIRTQMVKSKFTKGIRDAMNKFFQDTTGNIAKASDQIEEIKAMMDAMYKKFSEEHGLKSASPAPFSTLKYNKELAKLEKAYNEHFGTLTVYASERFSLTQKFFETVAARVVHVYEIANRDVENWLKAVMAPMETQVREHQLQLRRRLESIKRIHKATDTLEDRIAELEQMEHNLLDQIEELNDMHNTLTEALAIDANAEALAWA
jgi:DNA repair exonuclease SbcCD ATPase subunit